MSYISVDEKYEELVVINKSKFITTLVPIISQEDAQQKYKEISKKYSDATHNCYAYISNSLATEQRFSDDGEPQGTAGMPMLEVLKKKNVYMTLAVVTRYFGGIKLGASGLVSAYSSCVAQAIDNANKVEYKDSDRLSIEVDYSIYKVIEEMIINQNAQIESREYDSKVLLKIVSPSDITNNIVSNVIEMSLAKAIITKLRHGYNKFTI